MAKLCGARRREIIPSSVVGQDKRGRCDVFVSLGQHQAFDNTKTLRQLVKDFADEYFAEPSGTSRDRFCEGLIKNLAGQYRFLRRRNKTRGVRTVYEELEPSDGNDLYILITRVKNSYRGLKRNRLMNLKLLDRNRQDTEVSEKTNNSPSITHAVGDDETFVELITAEDSENFLSLESFGIDVGIQSILRGELLDEEFSYLFQDDATSPTVFSFSSSDEHQSTESPSYPLFASCLGAAETSSIDTQSLSSET